jgi:putative transcriptional regulator
MAAMKIVRRKTARRTTGAKTSEVGQALIASLREVRAWQRGELTLKVTEMPDPMPALRVKMIRRKVAKSVRIFSERFGLPANTVRQWEQGARRPDAASALLLEVIDLDPAVVETAAKRRQKAA